MKTLIRRFLLPAALSLALAPAGAAALAQPPSPAAQTGERATTTLTGYLVTTQGSETYGQALSRQSARMGHPEVIRYFYGDRPLAYPPGGGFNRTTPLVLSFNRHPAAVAAGRHDGEIRAFLARLPRTQITWLALNHEMDAKIVHHEYTAAQAKAGWLRFAQLVAEARNPMIRKTFVLTGWKFRERLASVWPGSAAVDVLGVDMYQWASEDPRTMFEENLAIAASYGKPLAVPEFGVWRGSDAQRAAFLTAATQDIQGRVQFITYFEADKRAEAGDHDWRIANLPLAAQAWRAAIAR